MDPKGYWIGLNRVRGIGYVRTMKLLNHFGDLGQAWQATERELLEAGLTHRVVKEFIKIRLSLDLESELKRIHSLGINILTIEDKDYPRKLLSIEQPPAVLYVKGKIEERDEIAVAVVGTRHTTAYGRQVALELSHFLARHSITVISGLARGIDSIAHEAVINEGGRTIAVLGCGVDVIYPPEHRRLYERIVNNGALISDYYPGTPPDGINFPPRNRIISGLATATVIVEAGERSGALITAEFAANQGREVFAVPGPIYAPCSKGTNRLIRDGAVPLTEFEDILTVLELTQIEEYRYAKKVIQRDEVEEMVANVIKNEPMHIDEIKNSTGLSMEKVSAALVMMELKGMVKQVGNLTYISISDEVSEYEVR